MTGLEIIGDMAGQWTEATSATVSGLRGLGATEYADSLDRLVSTLDILAGSMQAMGAVASVVQGINTLKGSMAVAETTASAALGPAGWAKIAVALGAAATASAVTFGVMHYTLRADLSVPAEATGVAQTIGVIA